MQSIEFKIKVITPTLMGGGFGQNDGIRPSEIKGMMRYWFRALAGSVVGNDIKALKSLEEKVSGSQERKSPFRTVISGLKETDKINLSWFDLPNGVKYLGFVINMNKERLNNSIKADSEFKVKFLFKNSVDNKIIKLVAYSFYLATALGGFGLRARRGFGSWQIEDIDTNVESLKENLEKLKNYDLDNIKVNIDKAEKILRNLSEALDVKTQNSSKNHTKLNFTNFIDYRLKQIQTDKTDWKDLLNDLGAYYRYFRVNPISNNLQRDNFKRKHSLDYVEIINRGRKEKELYNPIFGLNIIYKKDVSVNLSSDSEKLRRASPLFISVKDINDNLVINLFISISTNFKGSQQRVKLEFKKREFPVKVKHLQNYKTIINFIEKLEKAMGKQNEN